MFIPCLKRSPHPHISISLTPSFHSLSAQIPPHQRLSLTSLPKIYSTLYYPHFLNLFSVVILFLTDYWRDPLMMLLTCTCIRMGSLHFKSSLSVGYYDQDLLKPTVHRDFLFLSFKN